MEQTKPVFIIKKYGVILRAAIIIESVSFIVSLTDSIVAGSAVSDEAFASIGLVAPFLSISLFLATMISTGTSVNFSYNVGKFDKRRANEFFSVGLFSAIILGFSYALIMLLLGETIIGNLASSESIAGYLSDYYYVIIFLFFLNPISYLLDIMMLSDGSERLSVTANMVQIAGNVSLSLLLVQVYGVKGIAIATVVSKILYILIACLHFFKKRNTIRLLPYWKLSDFRSVIKRGFVRSLTYCMEALLFWIANSYVGAEFGSDALIVMVAVEKLLGMMTLFMGLSTACQPLIGTLQGEKNTKAQRILMYTALRSMIITGLTVTVIVIAFAPYIAGIFGITEGLKHAEAVSALRIVSSTMAFQAVMLLFFAYYIFINKHLLALVICLINSLINPLIMPVIFSSITQTSTGIWIGFAAAPVFSAAICSVIVLLKYGRALFPFLISRDRDNQISIYYFPINVQNAVEMSRTVEQNLNAASVSPKASALAGVITEDMLLTIAERNMITKKTIYAECTTITEDNGARLIIRDSGMIFDITDTDGDIDTFRQYIVSNLMLNQDRKLYMTTTGYNRNELYFE